VLKRAKPKDKNASGAPEWPSAVNFRLGKQSGLRWRIVGILLAVSLSPLLLVAVGSFWCFSNLLMEQTLELKRNAVRSHAAAIDLFLAERLRALELAVHSHTLDELSTQEGLSRVFEAFVDSYPNAFVDLGVIDGAGRHLSYVGPYDLKDRNYAEAPWFKSVMSTNSYISDVFLGYRQVPHSIMAVKKKDGPVVWILRATINNDSLYELVRTAAAGKTSDAFIIDTKGRYQTPPKLGNVLGLSSIAAPKSHQGVRDSRVDVDGKEMVQVTTWLNSDKWMLVVQQSKQEITEPVRRATTVGILVVLIAVGLVVVTIFLATWHLTDKIDRAIEQRNALSQDLMRSAKLASLGEFSAGLAHEINNPLAIISAEQTNLADQIGDLDAGRETKGSLLGSVVRCKKQLERCARITAKMLQFGRKAEPNLRVTDIEPLLEESTRLMSKRAALRNIEIDLDIEKDLPRLELDTNELEQVLVNLIGNAMYAIDGKAGLITVSAQRSDDCVRVSVKDNGSGISPENLDHIFQPFFTTKPLGQGTGLGLSVCWGIVRGWGGSIEAQSDVGVGTEIIVRLPIPVKDKGKAS
jgi:two-component system NtrC family sensor kinase